MASHRFAARGHDEASADQNKIEAELPPLAGMYRMVALTALPSTEAERHVIATLVKHGAGVIAEPESDAP